MLYPRMFKVRVRAMHHRRHNYCEDKLPLVFVALISPWSLRDGSPFLIRDQTYRGGSCETGPSLFVLSQEILLVEYAATSWAVERVMVPIQVFFEMSYVFGEALASGPER